MLLTLFRPLRLFVLTTLGASLVSAQEVLAPEAPLLAAAEEMASANITPSTPFFNWGPFALRPYVSYHYEYGDGLGVRRGDRVKSARQRFAPGVTAQLGPRWSLDYGPTWHVYSNDELRDNVSHQARVQGRVEYENWSILPTYRYSKSSPLLAETAEQTDLSMHTAALTVGRRLSDAFGVDLTYNLMRRYSDLRPDVRDQSISPTAHYRFSEPLSARAAVNFGRTEFEGGPDMEYYRPTVGLNYQVTGKTTVDLHAGWERRTYLLEPDITESTPIYGASLQLRPFLHTTITITGDRQVSPSLFTGQTRDSTSWGIDLNQRLLGRLSFGAGFSTQGTDYASAFDALAVVREDERDTLYFRLSTKILTRMNISIGYSKSDHDSNLDGYTYSSSQISADVSYRF